MNAVSDTELLERSGRGEADAFAALVERYSPLVHSIALSNTGRRDVAEDLAQEAFCRAYVHLNGLNDPERFRSWLWGITRRVCLDWRRKTGRHGEPVELPAEVPATSHSPAEDAEAAERGRRVRQAVDELPEDQRIVVQLRHLQGMSYEQIAGVLGLSMSGVSNRLAAAREKLRVKLRPLVK